MSKLTLDKIEALIAEESYHCEGTLTICVLTLTNGAQVVGKSNVIDPVNYDASIGRSVARGDAASQIFELEGYALKTRGPVLSTSTGPAGEIAVEDTRQGGGT